MLRNTESTHGCGNTVKLRNTRASLLNNIQNPDNDNKYMKTSKKTTNLQGQPNSLPGESRTRRQLIIAQEVANSSGETANSSGGTANSSEETANSSGDSEQRVC